MPLVSNKDASCNCRFIGGSGIVLSGSGTQGDPVTVEMERPEISLIYTGGILDLSPYPINAVIFVELQAILGPTTDRVKYPSGPNVDMTIFFYDATGSSNSANLGVAPLVTFFSIPANRAVEARIVSHLGTIAAVRYDNSFAIDF